MNIKQTYENFLRNKEGETSELEELMPGATGIWEKDKAQFTQVYKELFESAFLETEEEDEDIAPF